MGQPKRFTDEELRLHKNTRSAERYRENKEKSSNYHKELRARKKENDPEFKKKEAERVSKWRKDNPEKVLESAKKSRKKNAEKRNEKAREWFKNNKHKRVFYQRKRELAIKNRTVNWSSLKTIEYFYLYARFLSECTKVKHVVDHIIPLQGKNVSGLHVENNLIVITNELNQKKYNKLDFDFSSEKIQESFTDYDVVSYFYPEIMEKITEFSNL